MKIPNKFILGGQEITVIHTDQIEGGNKMTREEQIRQATRKYFDDYMDGLKGEVLTVEQVFEDAAKWADKTMVERVLAFIFENFYDHPHANGHICTDAFDSLEELEEELIKVMEG